MSHLTSYCEFNSSPLNQWKSPVKWTQRRELRVGKSPFPRDSERLKLVLSRCGRKGQDESDPSRRSGKARKVRG